MRDSKIQWTDHTFNPWQGCVKVSTGCKSCYAETLSIRLGHDIWGANKPRRFFSDAYWRGPLRWNRRAEKESRRARVFCASMADVFEEREDLEYERLKLWVLAEQTEWLNWLLLTKRPENTAKMFPARWMAEGLPSNVWMGVSVENQKWAAARIPLLLDIPAVVRFVSAEPLLGPVDLSEWLDGYILNDLDWVIIGGESGRGARSMELAWVRALRDQCLDAGIAVFVKQLGSAWARENRATDSKGGLIDEWPEDLRVRELP